MIHSASLRATGSEIDASACVASPGLCLRTSSMTFSSASLSLCEVDEVAATAAGVTGLRGGIAGSPARSRGAGAIGTAEAMLAVIFGAAALAAVGDRFTGAAAGIVLGTTLRAIGRGLGRGTFLVISSF